jgi:uncharacterized protein (DUF302 family)
VQASLRHLIPTLALGWCMVTSSGAQAQSPVGTAGFPFLLPVLPSSTVLPPNTMLPPIPHEAKTPWVQLFMRFNPLSMRDMLNLMAEKIPARPGLTMDQVVDALIARAKKHGFLLVNRYQMWKELQKVTGEPAPYKVEVISICDPTVSRDWLAYAPEMVLFVPPRIAVIEDHDRRIWVVMLDWDMSWIDAAPNAGFDPQLYAQGVERRQMLEDIMRAAANGEK